MKAFVTGGTGFIGGHIIKNLLSSGASVRALVRDSGKRRAVENLGAEPVLGDITNPDSLRGAFGGCEVLFHLGGVARWWVPDRKEFYRVNVEGTRNVMEEALAQGIKRVVYTSSLATLQQPKGVISTEDSEHRGDFESHYARSKYLGEREVMKLHRERGLPVVILNPGVVIGPGDYKTFGRMIIDYINKRLKAIPFPRTMVPLVYIDDVVGAHFQAADRGKPGERYILVGENISIAGAFRVLEKITGISPPEKTVSPLMLKLAASFMELKSFFTGAPPKLSRDVIRAMETGAMGDSAKAQSELDIEFTPLYNALRRTILWYRDEGEFPSGINIAPVGAPSSTMR
ncbi:MAG: SDR family oxidoreductase [Thermodesulfobacteriota bacterium]